MTTWAHQPINISPGVKLKNVQNPISVSTSNSGVGWFFQKFTEHHICGIFSESPVYEYIKNDDPGRQIQKYPKSYKCFNSQILGLVGFFKNSRNTIHVVYFWKALCASTSKMMILCVKFKNIQNPIRSPITMAMRYISTKVGKCSIHNFIICKAVTDLRWPLGPFGKM